MKTRTAEELPQILSGSVHRQFRRCGKPNCKCTRRGELHQAYYHFFRIGGKLRKRYLKTAEAEEIRKACALRQAIQREQRTQSSASWKQLRELRRGLREHQNL